ncbi:TetR/AcrR family transcriptional regulator [Pectinatus cerevisiiphilus]|uniref:TetR family transcriptional regulator n=1 Tax=Pectinatus cerevisiiphilus TaxID=86956 RepID=A0A4R3K383_9FIRM|nr:TetR/AcrR family transcriptional regulator [Pectinatus cerevisiiphilus]TCS77144.1 TetR family transcriptional regulator [Pectinatus cerevisiiphilus]
MKEKLTKRETKKLQSKKTIIESATKLFAEKGLSETSIADIMKEAQLGLGTFYNYFDSKESLLKELLNKMAEDIRSSFATISQTKETYTEILESVIAQTAALLDKNRFVLPLFIKAADKSGLPAEMGHESGAAPLFKYIFDGIIKKGQENNEFRSDIPAEIITEMFHSIFQAASFSSLPIDFCDNVHYKVMIIIDGLKINK